MIKNVHTVGGDVIKNTETIPQSTIEQQKETKLGLFTN